MSRRSRRSLRLTQRALGDIQAIFDDSVEQWGRKVANKYVDELEAGLHRLSEQPALLRPQADLHKALQFYRVNKHLLVCDVQPESVVVLTVIHATMDIPERLAELQPALQVEVEILHRKLRDKKSKE